MTGWLGNIAHDVSYGTDAALNKTADVGASIGTGIYDIGKATLIPQAIKAAVDPGTHTSWSQLGHEWEQAFTNPSSVFSAQSQANDPLAQVVLGKDFSGHWKDALSNPASVVSPASIAGDPLATDITAMGKGMLVSGEHPLRDPVETAITALMLASGGLSAAAKAAYVTKALDAARVESTGQLVLAGSDAAKAATAAGETVTPLTTAEKTALISKTLNPLSRVPYGERFLRQPKLVVPHSPEGAALEGPAQLVHTDVQLPASTSPVGHAIQTVHDAIVQGSLDRNALGDQTVISKYGNRRVAKALDEQARITHNTRAVLERQISVAHRLYDKGISRNVGEMASWLRSANVTPQEAVDFWKSEGQTKLAKIAQDLHDRGALTVDASGNLMVDAGKYPGLARADSLVSQGQALREGVIKDNKLITPEGAQTRLDLIGKTMRGGKYVKPTPGKLGKVPKWLERDRRKVAQMQKAHDRALSKAQAAGEKALGPEDTLIGTKIVGPGFPQRSAAASAVEPPLAEGYTRLYRGGPKGQNVEPGGYVDYTKGGGSEGRGTWFSHDRKYAQNYVRSGELKYLDVPSHILENAHAKNDFGVTHFAQKEWILPKDLAAQAKALRGTIPGPGRAVGANWSALAERRGAALSVAKDKLQQAEEAHTRRIEPTGVVGGEGRPGQAFVSLKTSVKRSPQSPISRAVGPIIPAVKKMSLGKRATGTGIAKGLVPIASTTRSVARGVHDALRFVNSKELRGLIAKHGSDVRRTADDILIRDPSLEKGAAQVPENIQQLLGRSESTLTEPDQQALRTTLEHVLQEAIPGLRDDFASDRAAELGTRAPEGWKWVPQQMLPDTLTSSVVARGKVEKFADALNSAVTSATVYFRLGHLPTRLLTNMSTNLIQGSLSPGELARSVSMSHLISDDTKQVLTAGTGTHGYLALPHAGEGRIAKAATAGAGLWARKVDAPFRLNSVLYELRQAGIDTPEAVTRAAEQLRDPARAGMSGSEIAKIDGAMRRANRAAIMYDGLSAAEKRHVARYVWFYPWTKGAVRFAGHTAIEHPVKAAAVYATGKQGAAARQAALGDGPEYERNLTPLTGGFSPLTSNFSSFTPFSTTGDVAALAQHPLNPDSGIGGQLNPVTSAVVDALRGDTYDAKQAFMSPVPELQIAQAALGKKPKDTQLFRPTNLGVGSNSREAAILSAIARMLGGPAVPRPTNKDTLNRDAHRKSRTIFTYSGG